MLTSSQRRYLRELAHSLKPVVMIGNKGVTPSVLNELDSALNHHELLKIRITGSGTKDRESQVHELLTSSNAELVQQVGHVASLYRPHPEQPKLALPR